MLRWFLGQPGIAEKVGGQMEYGKAIAVADLVDCRRMTDADADAALCDVYKDAWSWVLENIRKIEPFTVKGQLGIYEWDCKYVKVKA